MPSKGHQKPERAKFIDTPLVAALLSRPREAGHLRDAFLFGATFYLAGRVGEIVQLKPEHFHFDHKCVMVPTLKKKKKDADGKPLVPLVEVPIIDGDALLREMVEWAKGREWIFPGEKRGTHLSVRRAQVIFRSWAKVLGISDDATIHSLRHTALSLVAAHTKDVVRVRDFARHSNIATSNTYLHSLPGRWNEASGALRVETNGAQADRPST